MKLILLIVGILSSDYTYTTTSELIEATGHAINEAVCIVSEENNLASCYAYCVAAEANIKTEDERIDLPPICHSLLEYE